MFKASLLLIASLIGAAAPAAEVWKCQVGEQIQYSDQPCQLKGEALASRKLQGNVVETAGRSGDKGAATADASGNSSPSNAEFKRQENNVCPSDADIAGMETRASSIGLTPEAKAFMQDEVRRARQCRKGQGRYAAADWDISRQAQAAQTSQGGGADARRRAEAMHSAADPVEGERIARQREQAQEQAQREARQRRAD
jgi:hypothetical protein